MRFAQPGWLWFLLLPLLLFGLTAWLDRSRQRRFSRFAAKAVWDSIAPEFDPGATTRKLRLWLFAIFFGIVALARPQWGSHEETVQASGLDIMIALDLSNSMEVEDVVPSRLKKAKHWIHSFLDRLGGDRVGLVQFAASAALASPLTADLDYVLETVQSLSPKSIVNQGTDIGLAIDTAKKSLDRGAEEGEKGGSSSAASAKAQSSRVVILISDGEDQEAQAEAAAEKLRESGVQFYVLGVGTQKGGPVPVRDENGNLVGYKRDRQGQPVVSAFRPDALTQLAALGGGRYWNLTADEGEIDALLKEVGALQRGDYAERRFVVYEDRFQWPLFLAVLLLLLEVSFPARRILRPSLFLVASGLFLGSAQAAPLDSLDSYLENKKGLEAFREGKLGEAKQHFGSAQALEPRRPELDFNSGVTQLMEGDIENGIRGLDTAAKKALESGDYSLAGKSLFNRGSALQKKGEVSGAVESYVGAIQAARKSGDDALEKAARKNLELLIRQEEEKKQPEQQQKQQQKQQQQQQDQGQKPPEKEQGQQQQQQESQQPQEKEKQNGRVGGVGERKKFKSEKLSPEDAERVMSELTGRERELQGKLKRQNGKPSGSSQKDW